MPRTRRLRLTAISPMLPGTWHTLGISQQLGHSPAPPPQGSSRIRPGTSVAYLRVMESRQSPLTPPPVPSPALQGGLRASLWSPFRWRWSRESFFGPQLIRPDIEEQKRRILEHLGTGHRKVSEFTDAWMHRPTDIFSEKVYRRMLLELEAIGKIHVYDKNNRNTARASSRPTRNSAHTLGDDYWLRLPANQLKMAQVRHKTLP